MTAQDEEAETQQVHARALLVEDSPTDARLLKGILEDLGCRCDVAENGRRGVDLALGAAYDFVFMDIVMPELDGLEATRLIHETLGPQSPFIVAVSSRRSEADWKRCVAAGIDYFIAKPVHRSALTVLLGDSRAATL